MPGRTPLYAEDLLAILRDAAHNNAGAIEGIPNFDKFCDGLQKLIDNNPERIDPKELQRLLALASAMHIEPEQLDHAVYDAGGNPQINNDGLESQLEFLLQHNAVSTVENILRTVDEYGNYKA